MATKTEPRRKERGSERAERAADRPTSAKASVGKPERARRRPKPQDMAPAGRDEKSIGATRLPRKGDDSETD